MSKVETGKNRTPVILVALLVAQLLLMSSQARGHAGERSMLRSWMLTAVYPIQVGLGYVGSFIYNGWYGYFDLRGARQEEATLLARASAGLLPQDAARAFWIV